MAKKRAFPLLPEREGNRPHRSSMISSSKYSEPGAVSRSRRFAQSALFIGVLLISCSTQKKKDAQEDPARSVPAAKQPPSEATAFAKQEADAVQKRLALNELRQKAAVLIARSSHDAALVTINEALALDPQSPDFLQMKNEVSGTLAHRCCGKWLRYDFAKPGEAKTDLHGVLFSEDFGLNQRRHLFRGRVLAACGSGALSLRLRVPWDIPEGPAVKLDYTLGQEQGSETVRTDAAPFVYEFREPKKWLQKIAEHSEQTFEVRVPKRDGTQGKFTFELGEAKKIVDEVLSACK